MPLPTNDRQVRSDIAMLSAAAATYRRGDSEELLNAFDAEVERIRDRWSVTGDDEIRAVRKLKVEPPRPTRY